MNPKTLFIFQLTHSGELSNPEFSKRLSVKPLPGFEAEVFTEDEFEKIMEDFVLAAKITYDVGADGIDMKFCHGYLGSQILRPYNTRKWKYGGTWENRRQFAFDLYERIRKAVPDKNFLIGSKISVWEGFPGGFGTAGPDTPVIDLSEPIDLVKGLEERGRAILHPIRRQPVHHHQPHPGGQGPPLLRLPAPVFCQGIQGESEEGNRGDRLELLGVWQRQEQTTGGQPRR